MKIKSLSKLASLMLAGVLMSAAACSKASAETETTAQAAGEELPVVYYIKDITPENLVKIYKALGREATGNVAVKISTGESNKSNQLNPQLIGPLVKMVNGTIVECNTAYQGNRSTTEQHLKAAQEHG